MDKQFTHDNDSTHVQITYTTEAGASEEPKRLPFVVGVLGDFSGNSNVDRTPLKDRRFITIDRQVFDEVMHQLSPRLSIRVENHLAGDGSEILVDLQFRQLQDFEPFGVVQQVEPLKKLLQTRTALYNSRAELESRIPSAEDWTDAPQKPNQAAKEHIAAQASTKGPPEDSSTKRSSAAGNPQERDRQSSEKSLGLLDAIVSKQLAAIMHTPEFQQLEGSWRGLWLLVGNPQADCKDIKVRILDCSKSTLYRDLEKNAPDFDQSQLFKKVYDAEFGTAGGTPFGILLGDFEFTHQALDVDLLRGISGIAATAFCPFIAATGSGMLGIDSWGDISRISDLTALFQSKEYSRWNTFRQSEEARFVTLTLPRTLARLPYGSGTTSIEEFDFQEIPLDADGGTFHPQQHLCCWMNTAYVLGAKLTESFSKYGWCIAIRGAEGGGKVENLPTQPVGSDKKEQDLYCPTEVSIVDQREGELSRLGFLPLSHYPETDYAIFFSAQSTHMPTPPSHRSATTDSEAAARLPYIMATARFAHYIKAIARDRIGSFANLEEFESWLHQWIHQYVSADSNTGAEYRTRYPLTAAKIKLKETPGSPGQCSAAAWITPWLEMETELTPTCMATRIQWEQR